MGDIGLWLSEDHCTGELGFRLLPAFQGHRLATLAEREALQLFFGSTRATQVLGISDARNLPSLRLLERVGFVPVERREVVFRGEPCTEQVLAMLRPPD